MSYEATDAVGLKKVFQESVDDYLETCLAQKIKPEVPFKGSLNVRLGPDLHRRIAIAATQHHLSINKYIAQQLDRNFDQLVDFDEDTEMLMRLIKIRHRLWT